MTIESLQKGNSLLNRMNSNSRISTILKDAVDYIAGLDEDSDDYETCTTVLQHELDKRRKYYNEDKEELEKL